jgi:hypothetical protein
MAIVNCEMTATFREALLLEHEHLFPILLHVHNHPRGGSWTCNDLETVY